MPSQPLPTQDYLVRLAGLDQLMAVLEYSLGEAVKERRELVAEQVDKEAEDDEAH